MIPVRCALHPTLAGAAFPQPHLVTAILALTLLLLFAMPARSGQDTPLTPIDTSSPRTTIKGFLEFMSKGYATGVGSVQSYLASPDLYLSPDKLAALNESMRFQEAAQRVLDLSEVPPAIEQETARRLAIQLKEVLDRIEVPPSESIPDAEAMSKSEFKRWTLPNSEIQLRRVDSGPRAGEYLFSPATLSRLPEFYGRVKNLPYKPGSTPGWDDFSSYSPIGVAFVLRGMVPSRWLIDAPQHRVRNTFLDQPLWRWCAIVGLFGIGLAFVLLCFRCSRYWVQQWPAAEHWASLLRPLSLVVVTPLTAVICSDALRISGAVYQVVTLSLWTLFYLALTWAVWAAGGLVAASLIAGEKLLTSSIDSQLIRLVTRLMTVIVALVILVTGADRIGLPAYSVLAGLGVGGLAVALAAQQTLANLLGSLIIMFEKPFAIGHMIKVQGVEGTVENVGFRSTRIRTVQNSLVTIPSSQLVNSIVDNMALREYRQLKTLLNLTYDTPLETVEGFVDGVRGLLKADPDTRKDNLQVFLYELGPHSLDILVNLFLKVPNRATELVARQRILLAIVALAEARGVQFAFPTQTLHIGSVPGEETSTAAQGNLDETR